MAGVFGTFAEVKKVIGFVIVLVILSFIIGTFVGYKISSNAPTPTPTPKKGLQMN